MIAGAMSAGLILAGAWCIGAEVRAGRPFGAFLGVCVVCCGVIIGVLADRAAR